MNAYKQNVIQSDMERPRLQRDDDPIEYSRRIVARQSATVQRECARQNAILRGEFVESKEESMRNLGLIK